MTSTPANSATATSQAATATVFAATATTFAQTATSIAESATAEASATVSPTSVAPLSISPDESEQFVDLGATSTHNLTINSGLTDPGTINIDIESSEGWSLTVLTGEGDELEDSNDDGEPDIGSLGPDESVELVVEIVAPVAERAGVKNETRLTASRAGSGVSATAELTTTINSKLVLSIDTSSLATGDVVAGASSDAGSQEVQPAVSYVAPGAVVVTVSSNGMWFGSCFGDARLGDEDSADNQASLNWRLSGAEGGWIALSSEPDGGCFPNSAPGVGSYVYDLELQVDGTDEVDGAAGSITFGARGAGT